MAAAITYLTPGDDVWPNGAASSGNNSIGGADGNDTLSGGGGNDNLYGGEGDDRLFGGVGNDILVGDNGDDQLDGGAGADNLNGGDGFDSASYRGSTAGLWVDVSGALSNGDAAGDTFSSIERYLLSNFSDVFYGSDADETVYGYTGDDNLYGGNGDDVLEGGLGADNLQGQDGFDTASYRHATSGVTINGSLGVDGEASGDQLIGIEQIWGSDFADVMTAVGDPITLLGLGGNDLLAGSFGDDLIDGGAGDDVMTGGDGADVFRFTNFAVSSDSVGDFQDGVDHIQFTPGSGVTSMADLSVAANGPTGVIITLPDGSTITVEGMTLGTYDASDFIFGP